MRTILLARSRRWPGFWGPLGDRARTFWARTFFRDLLHLRKSAYQSIPLWTTTRIHLGDRFEYALSPCSPESNQEMAEACILATNRLVRPRSIRFSLQRQLRCQTGKTPLYRSWRLRLDFLCYRGALLLATVRIRWRSGPIISRGTNFANWSSSSLIAAICFSNELLTCANRSAAIKKSVSMPGSSC